MAEILLAISAWQLAMRLKQPMSRAGCYNFCQPSSVSNHWLFVPVPPLTWNCQVAILGMKGTHDENDGTGMAIRLRCLDVLEWVLLMMAWDADKSQDLFEDDCLHLLVGSGPHNSEATPYHWDIATCVHPALDPENYNYCVPKISARPFHVGTQFPTRSCTK